MDRKLTTSEKEMLIETLNEAGIYTSADLDLHESIIKSSPDFWGLDRGQKELIEGFLDLFREAIEEVKSWERNRNLVN